MADLTSSTLIGAPVSQANVSVAGSATANVLSIVFDEATELDTLMTLIEKCRVQIMDYYAKNHV